MATRIRRFGRVRRELRYYKAIVQDPRTPRTAKWLIGAGLAYLCTPFDLIPDFIPLLGQLDDLIIVPVLIGTAMILTPMAVKSDAERRTRRIRARTSAHDSSVLFEVEALPGSFGIRANGVDLAATHVNETLQALRGLLLEHRVLVISKQITSVQLLERYSPAFGKPMFPQPPDALKSAGPSCFANVLPIFSSAVSPDTPWRHSHRAFHPEAAGLMILCSVELSDPGRERCFVDMMAAYEALSPDRQRVVDKLQVRSSLEGVSPLVRTHPLTGRKSLSPLLDDRHAIVGLPERDGLALLSQLRSHVAQPELRCVHRFRAGDLLAWDPMATALCGASGNRTANRGRTRRRMVESS